LQAAKAEKSSNVLI